MNSQKVIEEFKKKYPGKRIIKNDEKKPTEILCEIDPLADHPEFSLAVSVIDQSIPHLHRKTTERYKVIKGTLRLFINDQEFTLNEGDEMTINLGEIHWAKGNETWIECYSEPGWTIEDHILVK